MSVSRDGGQKWARPRVAATAQVPGTSLDKDMILADPRRAGTVYAVWSQVNDLDVVPGEVVDTSDRREPSERGVGPMVVVPVEPDFQQA